MELARAELLIRRSDLRGTPYDRPFRLGFRVGACIVMLSWIIWDMGIDLALLSTAERWVGRWMTSPESACFAYVPGFAGLASTGHLCLAPLHDTCAPLICSCRCRDELHATCFDSFRQKYGMTVLDTWIVEVFPVYRGMFMCVLFLWCWGALLYVWGAAKINYLFMLELDPRRTANAPETIWEAATLTVVLFASFIVHFKTLLCKFPDVLPLGFWPLVPFVVLAGRSLFPWRERKQAWKALACVLVSPLVEVRALPPKRCLPRGLA